MSASASHFEKTDNENAASFYPDGSRVDRVQSFFFPQIIERASGSPANCRSSISFAFVIVKGIHFSFHIDFGIVKKKLQLRGVFIYLFIFHSRELWGCDNRLSEGE